MLERTSQRVCRVEQLEAVVEPSLEHAALMRTAMEVGVTLIDGSLRFVDFFI